MPIPSPARMKAMLQIAKDRKMLNIRKELSGERARDAEIKRYVEPTTPIIPVADEVVMKEFIRRHGNPDVIEGDQRQENLNKFLEGSKIKQRVYHGTGHDINELKPNQFFAFNPNHANSYAEYAPDRGGRGDSPNVMPANVRATNPAGVRDVEEAVRNLGFLKPDDSYDDPTTYEWLTENQFQNAPLVIEELKKRGFDSALIPDMDLYDNDIKSLQVFDPSNVKSAIGNQGTFDPNEPDITKAHGGAVHMAGGGDAISMAIQMAKKLPRNIVTGNERQANLNKFLENSKVKEKMYRGATPHFQLQGEPIFVSPTVRFAEKFPVGSTSPRIATNQNQTIYPLHVNATNPFDYENTDDIQKVIYEISKSDPEQAEKLKNEFKYYLDMGDKFGTQSGNWGLIENTLVQDAIKKLGYDSFYVNEENVKNLGVYDPSQVKTAIGNQGTFDPNDPDITKAKGGEVHMAGGGDTIKMALKMAKKATQNVLPQAQREANLQKFLAPSVEKRRMYHGTKQPNIESFRTRKDMADEMGMSDHYADERDAVFVSSEPDFTKNFSVMGYTDKDEAPTTYPVYVQAENPFDFENSYHLQKVKDTYRDMFHNPESEFYDPNMLKSDRDADIDTFDKRVDELPTDDNNWMRIENPKFQDVLKDLGFDSFYTRERGTKNLGVYDPNRIKSAIGNQGTYDLGEDDINKARGGAIHMAKGGAEAIKQAIKQAKNLPPPENARLTQIIGTLPTYEKARMLFELNKAKGRGIDYGAGLGEGAKILKADTYEPYPQDWKPTFTNPEDIPDEAYGKLTNLNVLNVVPREVRDEMVLDMGRVMRPKSHGIITTRGADVMKTQGEKGPEPMSMITSRETYQKGFEKNELIDYLRYMLGDDFDINKLNLGKAGAMIQKKAGGGEVIKQAVKQAKKASKAENTARGLYHPIGGGKKLVRPISEMGIKSVDNPNMPLVPKKIITYEDMLGGVGVPLTVDRSGAGKLIQEVGVEPLIREVPTQGGIDYTRWNEAFASLPNVANRYGNRIVEASKMKGVDPDKIFGLSNLMSHTGIDFSHQPMEVLLNQFDPTLLDKKRVVEFNKAVQSQPVVNQKTKKVTYPFINFAGIETPEGRQELLETSNYGGELRKNVMHKMNLGDFEDMEFPSIAEARTATTEPRLLDEPTATVGHNVARFNPEGIVTYETDKPHYSYTGVIKGHPTLGGYAGEAEQTLPMNDIFQEYFDVRRALDKPESSDMRALSMSMPIQKFNDEWLDRVKKAQEARDLKIKTGEFKAGGAVGMKEGGKGIVSLEGVTYQPDPIYTDPMGFTVPLSINENESIYKPILKDDQMRLELAKQPKPIATPISFNKEPYRDPLTGILVDDPLSALPPGANVKPSTKYPQVTPFPTSLEPPKNTMTPAGIIEPIATVASAVPSFMTALPYAFGKSLITNSDFPTNFNEAMSAGTYIPRTQEGLENLESVSDKLDKVMREYKLAPIMPELHGLEPIIGAGLKQGVKAGVRGGTNLTKGLGEKAYLSTENMLRNQGLMPSVVPQGQTTTAPISPKDDFGFYSKLERSALNLQRKQGNGQAFINELRSKGATPEELDMSGLKEFLATKPNFTKQEVQDYVQMHRPKLNERVLVDRPALDSMINEKLKTFGYSVEDTIEGATGEPSYIFRDKNGDDVDYEDLPSDVQDFISENFSSNTIPSAKYADMKGTRTPGGENYREVLITYPKRAERGSDSAERKNEIAKVIFGADSYDSLNYRQKESVLSRFRLESQVYNKGHFGDVADNVMAHLRLDDRTDVDGKKGTLVDELQSDIHQEGRESGYKKDFEENDEINQLLKKRGNEGLVANEVKQLDKLITNATLVPDAPYKEDWYKVGLKKAIQKAVENGDDRIYTPTGKDLINRYESELRKNVDYISYEPFEEDGVKYYEISAGKNNEEVFSKEGVNEEELQKLLGKSIAKKIINNQGESAGTDYRPGWKMLVGDDLSIGGSGMIEYYDKRYPAYLKSFAEKYGGTVGETKIYLNKKYYLADLEGNLLDDAGWTKEKDAIEAGEWKNRGSDNQNWQVIQKKEVTQDDMKKLYGYSDEEWARVSPEQRNAMASNLNKDSLRKVYYYEPSEEAKKKIIGGLPYKDGGIVKMAGGGGVKKATQMAIKTASQGKVGQLANKDLLTVQDFQTSMGDEIRARAKEMADRIAQAEYKYNVGDRVFTDWTAKNNYPPYEILGRRILGGKHGKILRDPETNKALRDENGLPLREEEHVGYQVRHDFTPAGETDAVQHITSMPESSLKGLVEPDEPYRKGGAVHMDEGGLPIRAHNREFETPDLMNARDIGVTGDYENKSLTLGKQQMRKDFDDATKMKREMDYIRYSQPFREGRLSAMAMKDPSNPIYQGMLQYEQPMMGGNAGIGLMGMRTPEEDYKLKALQLMYQKQLGKDASLSGFAGLPFGGKPMGGVQIRGRFAEGGKTSMDDMKIALLRNK